jgi:hypothetical protein
VPARLAIVANAALLLATGCGGGSKHKAIGDYITRVDEVQQGMAGPLQQVTRANQSFARSQTDSKVEVKLETSERTMARLRARLAKVVPPQEAKHLQTLMLRLVDRETALAHETVLLAGFVRRYQAALKPMQAASATLKKELAVRASGAAATKALDARKADELTAFALTIDGVIPKVESLSPPAVWKPAWADQLTSLRQLRSAALALAAAIHANDAAAVPALLVRFDRAAVSNQTTAAQKREIAAVKAYDAQLQGLVQLAKSIQLERARLQAKYK